MNRKYISRRLANNYSPEEMKLMMACVRRSPQARPPMSQVCDSFTNINYGKCMFFFPNSQAPTQQVVLVLEGIATPDTLGDEPIPSSGDLTSGSAHSMSSSNAGYITTENTTDLPFRLETEYMTACVESSVPVNSHITSHNLPGLSGIGKGSNPLV